MLQAVQFPAGISNLGSSLANVDRDTFPLQIKWLASNLIDNVPYWPWWLDWWVLSDLTHKEILWSKLSYNEGSQLKNDSDSAETPGGGWLPSNQRPESDMWHSASQWQLSMHDSQPIGWLVTHCAKMTHQVSTLFSVQCPAIRVVCFYNLSMVGWPWQMWSASIT